MNKKVLKVAFVATIALVSGIHYCPLKIVDD